jgi:hypothetical protein
MAPYQLLTISTFHASGAGGIVASITLADVADGSTLVSAMPPPNQEHTYCHASKQYENYTGDQCKW